MAVMEIFGLKVKVVEGMPKDTVMVAPPWVNEVRILGDVAVRFRGVAYKDGKTYKQFSPLTEDEIKHFAVIKNLGTPSE